MAEVKIIVTAQDRASGALGRIGGALGSMATVAGGIIAAGAITKIASGLASAGTAGLSFNNSMEQVTARLNAFTKDGQKSAEIMDMIRTRAAATPFAFEEMANAAAALLPAAKQSGAALEGLIEQAEILAASNPAQGLEGAAFALKEALGGDFVSAIERFNLSRQYINQLKEEGVPNLEIISRAMQQMGLDTDLVSNLATTAEGRWSTFKDTLVGLAAQVTKPIFNIWSAGLGRVNSLLEANAPLIEAMAASLAGNLQNAINWVNTTGVPAMMRFGETFNQLATQAQPFVTSLNSLIATLSRLQVSSTAFTTSFQTNWGALVEFFGPTWERIKLGFQGFTQALQPMLPAWQQFMTSFQSALPGLTKLAELIGVTLLFALKALGEVLAVTLPLAGQAFADMFTFMTTAVGGFLEFVGGAVEMIVGLFNNDLAAATAGAEKVFGGLRSIAMAALQPIINAIDRVKAGLASIGDKVPSWLIPGSPTAFEVGLLGVAGAFNEMARQINPMAGALSGLNGMQPLALGAGGNLGTLQAVKGELAQIYALTHQLNAAGVNLNINSVGNVAIGRGSSQGSLKLGGMTKL